MLKPRRKHRKSKGVPAGWKGCRCPAGSRKVSTCTTRAGVKQKCKGRGWGCLGIGPSQKGKPSPRFLAALCPTGDAPKLTPPSPSPVSPRPYTRIEVKVGPGRRSGGSTTAITTPAPQPSQPPLKKKRVSARRGRIGTQTTAVIVPQIPAGGPQQRAVPKLRKGARKKRKK